MTQQRKSHMSHLNDASDKTVKPHNDLEAETENLPNDDKMYKVIKSKVDSVVEACANQQQVSREVYTEQNEEIGKKDLGRLNFTIGRIFRCSICKGEFTTDKEYKRHINCK